MTGKHSTGNHNSGNDSTGKKSRKPGLFGLSPRANGAILGLAAIGVAATTLQATAGSSESGTSVASVQSIPKQRSAEAEPRTDPEKGSGSSAKPDETDKRSKVIELAKTWNPHSSRRVPYSQTDYHNGYRTDCSGFVAMTLGLAKPGPNTVGLTSSRYTERIKMSELKKGDLVMDAEGTNTTRHVVIFEKWANKAHTSYWAYEQRGRYGTDYRTRDYGLDSGSEYKAYRPKKLSGA
ncbi:hypothetical protein [Actinomadura geliboluensis]|uniref:hypothetical protein n=1 Tax=Actinomadura geliboluensis TaxID=882440 RepID=UPI00372288B3